MHNGFRPDYELHIFARCAKMIVLRHSPKKMGISLESCDHLVHALCVCNGDHKIGSLFKKGN